MTLVARQYSDLCTNQYGQVYRCRSSWNNWGRWVALAVILIAAFVLFFLCSCLSARKRRRRGHQPFYGTGWAGRTPFGHGQAQYNPNYQTQQPPAPPAYNQGPQNPGGYYGENQGYFGGRQNDVEMTAPQNTYGARGDNYAPPPGPPPNKV